MDKSHKIIIIYVPCVGERKYEHTFVLKCLNLTANSLTPQTVKTVGCRWGKLSDSQLIVDQFCA